MTIYYDLINPEEPDFKDSQSETYYFDTHAEAEEEAKKHLEGQIEGEYDDGTQCVVSDVIVEDEPRAVDYFDDDKQKKDTNLV